MDLNKVLHNSQLVLEQEFYIASLKNIELDKTTKEELLDALVRTTQLLMLKENMIKHFLKDAV